MSTSATYLTPENYGSGDPSQYRSIQDYLNYVFIRTGDTISNMQFNQFGQEINTYYEALKNLNMVYEYATDDEVVLNQESLVDTTATNANISSSEFTTIQSSIYNGYVALNTLVDSGKITGTTLTYFQDVVSDLESYGLNVSTFSKTSYYNWYQDTSIQTNLESALNAVQSIGTQQQENLKQAMFIYQQFIKGGSSLMSTLDQSLQTMTLGIRS